MFFFEFDLYGQIVFRDIDCIIIMYIFLIYKFFKEIIFYEYNFNNFIEKIYFLNYVSFNF